LADFIEEGILRQQRRRGEGRQRQRDQRQRQMPEIVEDLLPPGKLGEIVGDEAAQREPVKEGAAGEKHDQEYAEQEAWNGIADDHDAGGPYVERGAILHRLADAERNGDQVGDDQYPEAE